MELANWFPRLYCALLYGLLVASIHGASTLVGKVDNELVDAIRQVMKHKEKDKCMALFDFSGSLAYGSLDSAILYYQIDQIKFGFSPTEFREAFYFSPKHTKIYGDKKKSLREVKNDAKYERFKLLMLFYHQQFGRKVQNEKACASLKNTKQVDGGYEAGEIKQVVGTVTIQGQSARVQYTFDFKIYTKALDLIKVLNAESIHTVIVTEAENTMMSLQ
ncbi:unnamed protein product [Albugo candida]|uniref:Uncharacterized protein n=1 Tax=Albugo candida TaxID=65357 RepID=A0A024FX65_9STRA|nr:unnamed protein product [Albugo candida]|eukprot:CCI11611.1 unnamed protein product [Albugo candida]